MQKVEVLLEPIPRQWWKGFILGIEWYDPITVRIQQIYKIVALICIFK